MKPGKFYIAFLLVTSLLLCQAPSGQATTNEELLFQQGNEAFSRGDYDQAIARYEELITAAGFSPAVLFNLANSYAQAGKIGLAVLNYERAQRLDPGDSDIAGNLDLVRKESGLFAGEITGVDKIFHYLNLNHWAILVLIVLLGFTFFQAASCRYPVGKKTRIAVRIACLLLLLLSGTGTVLRYQDFKPSVVVSADARLLISPFTSANSIGAIQEGRLVFPQKIHGAFTYVRDETNRQGWILSSSLEAVVR